MQLFQGRNPIATQYYVFTNKIPSTVQILKFFLI